MIKLKTLLTENKEYFTTKKFGSGTFRISYRQRGYVSDHTSKFTEKDEFGMVLLTPIYRLDDEYLEVRDIYLDDDFIGKGFGKNLYQKALEIAKKNGYKGIASDTTSRSENANRFWKKYSVKKISTYDILEMIKK